MPEKIIYMKIVALLCFMFSLSVSGQEATGITENSVELKQTDFYAYRGTNAIDIAIGTSVINGDFTDPVFEVFGHIGYKRYIFPYLNINVAYNKFNLANEGVFNEGFMSFDLNLEYTIMPYKKFTPFIFIGGGYNASNDFNQTATKSQAGIGLEYIVADGFGVKLYTDYNTVFSDELEGLVYGDSDDVYWRVGLGINFYFGGKNSKVKALKGQETIIITNPIIQN
jgi:hypothetical protein